MKEVQNNWPIGIEKTRQRESVLSVLESTEKPLTTDICSEMGNSGDAV
ncbi:MAG: hypothetical protein ACYDG2_01565 [Ruminiclostridium sp.]